MVASPGSDAPGGLCYIGFRARSSHSEARGVRLVLWSGNEVSHEKKPFEIRVENEDGLPPAYEHHSSVQSLLNIAQDARRLGLHGIKSAFDVLGHRHFDLYIDSSHTLQRDTWSAIMLTAGFIVGNAKARDVDLTVYFTTYPNRQSTKLSSKKQGYIDALTSLWRSSSYHQAVQIVDADPILNTKLGLGSWIHDEKNFGADASEDEKHLVTLNKTRQAMIPLWHGWNVRHLELDLLYRLHISAMKESKKQPKSLNSVHVTYDRAINHYKRNLDKLKTNSTSDVAPTTILLLLGSPIQPSELQAIKSCQGISQKMVSGIRQPYQLLPLFGDKPRPEAEDEVSTTAQGVGTQFQISTMLCTGHLDKQTIDRYRQIDDFARGEDDINDLLCVDEERLLRHFLGPKAVLKLFNSHNPLVDGMVLAENDIYSKYDLRTSIGDHVITIPAVKQLKEVHGVEDLDKLQGIEDDDDHNNDGISRAPQITSTKVTVRAKPEDASATSALSSRSNPVGHPIGASDKTLDLWGDSDNE